MEKSIGEENSSIGYEEANDQVQDQLKSKQSMKLDTYQFLNKT